MSIARISSLFVLGALALSACVVSTNDGDGSGGRSGSGGSTTGGGAGKAGSSGGSGQAGGDGDASAGAAGQGGLGGSAGEAGADGSAGGAAGQAGSAGAAAGGAAGHGGGAGADSGACDDSVGTHPDCSGISPNCSSLPVAKTSCEQAPNHFKPRVARNVSSCIIGLTPDEQCSPTELYTCFDDALRAACDDASAGVSCTAIVAACPIIAAAQCRLYLSGMTASARASMTACMSSLLNGCNLPACIRAL